MNQLPQNFWEFAGLVVMIGFQVWSLFRQNRLQANQTELHGLVNSRMTELLELTRKSSEAEGKESERRVQEMRGNGP